MAIKCTNWALQQELEGPSAQFVLHIIADCANEQGIAFPSIGYLAKKTRQSPSSVRRRLKDLESLGLLVRFVRTIKGRRTSDELRLRLDHSVALVSPAENHSTNGKDVVEASADTDLDIVCDQTATDDPHGGPSQIDTPPKSDMSRGDPTTGDRGTLPQVTGGPYQSWEGYNPLLEPRENPNTCEGFERRSEAQHKATVTDFKQAYPIPILHIPECIAIWTMLSGEEQSDAIAGAKAYAAFLKQQDRKAMDAVRFLRERKWEGFVQESPTTAPASVDVKAREGQSILVAHAIANRPKPFVVRVAGAEHTLVSRPLTPAMLALGACVNAAGEPDRSAWEEIPEGSRSAGAWSAFLYEAIGQWPIHRDLRASKKRGFYAPWPFPPRKDGSTGAHHDPPQEASPSLSEADQCEFIGESISNHGQS